MSTFTHIPVLLQETMTVLEVSPGMVVADLTVGCGGHALEICKRIGPNGRLYAFDRDADALAEARRRLADAPCPIVWLHADFRQIAQHVPAQTLDRAFADLGVSSPQLDRPERGFSYRHDGPLDMRMDPLHQTLTAYDVIHSFSEDELADIFFRYGEEHQARRIAHRIVLERQRRTITRTVELAEIVRQALPPARRKVGHPARKTFQALRIFVNRELESLEVMLDAIPSCLKPGGILAIISFHSLEDRIVKQRFRSPPWQALFRRPIVPTAAEVAANPRARPAKLRAARVLPPSEEE